MERRVALVGVNLSLVGVLLAVYGIQAGEAGLVGAGAGLLSAGLIVLSLSVPASEERVEALSYSLQSMASGLSWILVDLGLEKPWITAVPRGDMLYLVYHRPGAMPREPEPGPGPGPSFTLPAYKLDVESVVALDEVPSLLYTVLVERMGVAELVDARPVEAGLSFSAYGLKEPFSALTRQPSCVLGLLVAAVVSSAMDRAVTVQGCRLGAEVVEGVLEVGG